MSKDPQTNDLVTALLMVSPKNIASFPIDQDGKSINLLMSALAEIKEKDLFDLSELTVSANVDQSVHNLVAHAKNENVIAFGVEISPEKLIQEQQQKEILKENDKQKKDQKDNEDEINSFATPKEEKPNESINDFEKYASQEQNFSIDDMDLEDSPLENSLSQSITKNTGIADEIGVFNKKVLDSDKNSVKTSAVEKESKELIVEIKDQENFNENSSDFEDDYLIQPFPEEFDNMEPPQFEQIPDNAYDEAFLELPEDFEDDFDLPDFNPDELKQESSKKSNRPKNK